MSRMVHRERFDTDLNTEPSKPTLTRRQLLVGVGAMMASVGLGNRVLAEGSGDQSMESATQDGEQADESDIALAPGVQYATNPNLYSGAYINQNPELGEELIDTDFEKFLKFYNISTEAAPGWESSWSEFVEQRGYEKSVDAFADRFAAALNVGCRYDNAAPFLESGNTEAFADWVVNNFDAPLVRALYGFDGEIPFAVEQSEYDDDWIMNSLQYKSFVAAHRAVLKNYFNTLLEKKTADQAIRVRRVDAELNEEDVLDGTGFYSVNATLGVIHEVNGASSSEIVGAPLYIGFYPKDELGLNTIVLPNDTERLELFKQIITDLK